MTETSTIEKNSHSPRIIPQYNNIPNIKLLSHTLNGPLPGDNLSLSHKQQMLIHLIRDSKHDTTCTKIPKLPSNTNYTQNDNSIMTKIQIYDKISTIIKNNNNTNTPTATATSPTSTNHKCANLVETDHESKQQQ